MKKLPRALRFARRPLVVALSLVLLVFVASFFVDEPLRRSIERRMNDRLQGYVVRLPKLRVRVFSLSIALEGLTVRQKAHPEPPVLHIERLTVSVHWRALLSARLVADVRLERPRVDMNVIQLREEVKEGVPVNERGWQEALQEVTPPEDPSPIHVEATLFGSGRGVLDGHANFLAKPYPGFHALFHLDTVPLDALSLPVRSHTSFVLAGGILAAAGDLETSPSVRNLRLSKLSLSGVKLDYVQAKAGSAEPRAAGRLRFGSSGTPSSNRFCPVSIASWPACRTRERRRRSARLPSPLGNRPIRVTSFPPGAPSAARPSAVAEQRRTPSTGRAAPV